MRLPAETWYQRGGLLRDLLQERLAAAVEALVRDGVLPSEGLPPAEVADPKEPEHGDFSCAFALAASKPSGKQPREIAERLREELVRSDGSDKFGRPPIVQSAEVAGPGFLNIRLEPSAIAAMVPRILELNDRLPRAHPSQAEQSRTTPRQNLNVEFVSVNPNGPITVGSGRGAAFGSTLCNVLEAVGHKVHREYYVNDGTNSEQMRLFAESVKAYAIGATLPDNGYKGDYVESVSQWLLSKHGSELVAKKAQQEDGLLWFQRESEELMIASQREDLAAFATTFQSWFSEQTLYDSGVTQECIESLVAKGAADEEPFQLELVRKRGEVEEVLRHGQQYEVAADEPHRGDPREDAAGNEPAHESDSPGPHPTLWLRSTKFGDDKDRVLRRKDGRWTYIASDVAYHKSKFERGSPPLPDAGAGGPRRQAGETPALLGETPALQRETPALQRETPARLGETPALLCEPADKLITILGPDHHGYIGRLRAVVAALLEEVGSGQFAVSSSESGGRQPLAANESLVYRSPEERDACLAALEEAKRRLEVLIFQVVRFVKDGKPAPMRKRDGNIYSLRDLMEEIGRSAAPKPLTGESDEEHKQRQITIGKDVARFFYLMRSHDTHMDFDLDLAERQSDENPVYYVQYAHARICSVLRKAADAGFGMSSIASESGTESDIPHSASHIPHPTSDVPPSNFDLLSDPKELALIKKICDLPDEVRRCAEDYGVHRLTTYAIELARAFHHFYDSCRVLQPEHRDLSVARIELCRAAKLGLQCALGLLGVSAPERMDREQPD